MSIRQDVAEFIEACILGCNQNRIDRFAGARGILSASPAERGACLAELLRAGLSIDVFQRADVLGEMLRWLLDSQPVFNDEQIGELARALGRAERVSQFRDQLIAAVDSHLTGRGPSAAISQGLNDARRELAPLQNVPSVRSTLAWMDGLLARSRRFPLVPCDAWAATAMAEFNELAPHVQAAWAELLEHTLSASTARPSARWTRTAVRLLAALPADDFRARLLRWLPQFDRPRTGVAADLPAAQRPVDLNCIVLKGLLWAAAEVDDAELARAVGRLAISAFRKVPGVGPRAVKVGNAAIYSLARMANAQAIGQLAYLKTRVRTASFQKEIEKALAAIAEQLGLPRDDVEELGVPDYGLTGVGSLETTAGEFTAQITVETTGKCTTVWRNARGTTQKSVPAAVKSMHSDRLRELKGITQDLARIVPSQRDRLDGLFVAQKRWPVEAWHARYIDHRLVGILARRLIWRFAKDDRTADGVWLDGQAVNVDDEPIDWLDERTTVELWHPIGQPREEIRAWRAWLERHEFRQPFKQAHREVYLLTDAERRTATYSNRFAAHILRQHQFHALCGARGWKDQLRLGVDAFVPPPTKFLPVCGLRAEFWVEGVVDGGGVEFTERGAYRYLATDQVRFYAIDAAPRYASTLGGGLTTLGARHALNEPLPLETIPPRVLSEVLRDIDLFVGVSSVGNDPSWMDGGSEGRYFGYWQSVSFGDLSATAQVRKDVLQRLIPRLAIGPRCSIDEKYLIVRGDLRSYKIHLGSGNILMTPNDQYLCIVADQSDKSLGRIFLPFEGDRTLSMILSKALLLAADTKITDDSILSQIRHRD